MTKSLRTFCLAAFVFGLIFLTPLKSHVTADDVPLYGYSAESSRTERQWEDKLRAIPKPENLRAYMQHLAARPHNVGSPYDKDNAEWISAKFKEFGLDAHIEDSTCCIPTPKERPSSSSRAGRSSWPSCRSRHPEDPTSNQQDEQLPTYNAYSIDGDVTAPLVYVNYGIPEDYEELERHGVSVKGAIVIARYGHAWRGIKPKVPRSMARWAASSIPIRATTAIFRARRFRTGRSARKTACSAAACRTAPSSWAIR